MSFSYRSNDAVITVCQNNTSKSIEITHVNKMAEELLGYSHSELSGEKVETILPPRIGEMLTEYVEFEDGANDVGEVLSKVQSFSIVSREGKETGFRLKVVRAESLGDKQCFELVLQDKTGLRKNEALRLAIQENFKGHEVLDADTGLPDRYSLNKDIDLISHYNNKGDLRSCFAVLQIDHVDELFAQYGRPVCIDISKHTSLVCRQNVRPGDVVGTISYKRIGVLLLDTTPESARMALNRLRWQIAANPFLLADKSSVGLSVSISFCRVGAQKNHKNLIDECESTLDTLGASAVNALIEL